MNLKKLIFGIILVLPFAMWEIYIGTRLYKKEKNKLGANHLIVILLYILYLSFNAFITGRYTKIVLNYAVLITFYKVLYKKDWTKSVVGSFLVYCVVIVSEIIISVLLSIIIKITGNQFPTQTAGGMLFINLVSITINVIIYKLSERKILEIMKSANHFKTQQSTLIFSILLITATLILNKISITNWNINFEFIINTIILGVFFIILSNLLIKTQKYGKIQKKYSQLSTYSQVNDDLLEEYRMKSHEFNNQLAIIKTMSDSSNKELQEYLDTLIKKNEKNKYSWINEVKYIQLAGLKGLINYKIMEMKSLKLNIELSISKQVKKFDFKNFTAEEKDHLYSIIGVYLDNAKEAALLSKDKEIVIDIYADNGEMIITIGNTYNGEINLVKIGEYNYSTKGKSRGVGLHLVKNIIKSDDKFNSNAEIRGKFFIQELTIKSANKKMSKV